MGFGLGWHGLPVIEEKIDLHCDVLQNGESRAQCRIILCDKIGCNPDGGIKPEAYDEVKKKAEALGPWPLQDGAWTSLLSSLVEMNDFNLTIAALNVLMVSLLNGDATQCRTWILIQ